MTGPCETEAIRRDESPRIMEAARQLDEGIRLMRQGVAMLEESVSRLGVKS